MVLLIRLLKLPELKALSRFWNNRGERGACPAPFPKYKGRKPIDYNEAQMKALCRKWRAGEITATAAMKELSLKPNTFYRRVKEMEL